MLEWDDRKKKTPHNTRLTHCSVLRCFILDSGHFCHHWSEWVKSFSRVWLFATPWTVAYKAPLSMEFSRQEYWSGFPLPSPGDLPNPGIEPGSPSLQADALSSEPQRKHWKITKKICILIYSKKNSIMALIHDEDLYPSIWHRFKKKKVKVAQSCPTLQPHGLYSSWNSLGQNTGVVSCSLLQKGEVKWEGGQVTGTERFLRC